MSRGNDDGRGKKAPNLARFFVENRQIAWVLLVVNLCWGCGSYFLMPQRKDPYIPMRRSLATVTWPGASAQQVEDLVTKPIEEAVSRSNSVAKIESVSRPGVSFVYIALDEYLNSDMDRAFNDIKIKLDEVHNLPPGAGPLRYEKDFGDTATVTLSVASPPVSGAELAARAETVRRAIRDARWGPPPAPGRRRFTLAFCFPETLGTGLVESPIRLLARRLETRHQATRVRVLSALGFVGIDGLSPQSDGEILAEADSFLGGDLHLTSLHPDCWAPVVIRDPETTRDRLATVAGDEYTYRELDDATNLIARTMQSIGSVSKVTRSGLLPENVVLSYAPDRLAALGLRPGLLPAVLSGQNVASAGGTMDVQGRSVRIDPPHDFRSEKEIGDVPIMVSAAGAPVALRNVAEIERDYQDPPPALDYHTWQDHAETWHRTRAVTLAIYMRAGGNIEQTGRAVDAALASLKTRLPPDLRISSISDQPQQVRESVGLFLESLWQAVVLVVLVSLIGFREWRSALLMACAIPLTLAMTVGMMAALGLDIQQVSVTSLIIALGLLVDDPVVAGDAIKRELGLGRPPRIAAWLGPTKLGTAIAFATLTNIVAYLPFLTLKGDTGRFLYSLPVVMTCALVASRIVSMTFVPLLGFGLLRATPEGRRGGKGANRFPAFYRRVVGGCIKHRKGVAAGSLLFLALGGLLFTQIKQSFFPADSQYLSYLEIHLPEDASLGATNRVAARAERIVADVAAKYGAELGPPGRPKKILVSLSTFVGSGAPRFWFTLFPQQPEPNYAMIIMRVADKPDTMRLQYRLQDALSAGIPGARIDVHELETGRPIGIPVAVRITGDDPARLRQIADAVEQIYRGIPVAARVRDDWGAAGLHLEVRADPNRAILSGVTAQDIADASGGGVSGRPVGVMREGDTQIPIVARLRLEDRGRLEDLNSLYVYSSQGDQPVPLGQVATIVPRMEPIVLRRRNQFPCITVSCFPTEGHLASDVDGAAQAALDRLRVALPAGYRIEQGGELEEQQKAFLQLVAVLAVSVVGIYLALVFEFKNIVKPLLVFAAVPYGMVGSVVGLSAMAEPFGFMAFLGIISLVGVLVSHIIVLFDYIEAAHARGETLEMALLDAGVQRLRPILITVGATVIAFIPLALHGGPLWEPLCYAQIGGLCAGAFTTLLLVPTLYTIFVRDWKIVKWDQPVAPASAGEEEEISSSPRVSMRPER